MEKVQPSHPSLYFLPAYFFPGERYQEAHGAGFPGLAGEASWVLVPCCLTWEWSRNYQAIPKCLCSLNSDSSPCYLMRDGLISTDLLFFLSSRQGDTGSGKTLLLSHLFVPLVQVWVVQTCETNWFCSVDAAGLSISAEHPLSQQSPTLWQTWISLAGEQRKGWSLSDHFLTWVSWQLSNLVKVDHT